MAHETDHDRHHHHHHLQAYSFAAANFSSGHSSSIEASHGLFELQAGMETLGMASNSKHCFPNPEGSSSGAASGIVSLDQLPHNPLLIVDDPSPRCQFPSQSNHDVVHQFHQGLSLSLPHHHQMQMMDERFYHQIYNLKSSVYLRPAQELLNEFCNLDGSDNSPRKQSSRTQDQGEASSSSPTWSKSALFSVDMLELEKRKARLLSMLEEV